MKHLTPYGVETLAYSLFQKYKLDGWTFRWDNAKRRAGYCLWHHKRIQVSIAFFHLNTDEEVVDTVLHEVAHAIAGQQAGHGHVWQIIAAAIGAKPQRYCTEGTFPKGQWVADCHDCTKTFRKHRKPRTIRVCGSCRRPLKFKREVV